MSIADSRLRPISRLAVIALCLISIYVGGRQAIWYLSHDPAVSDFRIFMTGIDMVRSGQGRNLYSFDAQQRAQERLYPGTQISGLLPFNHLAFELLYYWPVSRLPYRVAIVAWALVNVVIVLLIGWLLAPYTQALRQRTGVPMALFLFAFFPVIYAMGEGQDSLLFFLLLVLSLRFMDSGSTALTGFLLALACFKFHLALLVAFFVLVLARKWRGLAGLAAGGIVVGGISLLMVGPGIVPGYLAMLREQGVKTPWGFNPWFMPNLRGVLQWGFEWWLDVGLIVPIIFFASAVVGVVAAWLILRGCAQQDSCMTYSIAILTTILIGYHLHMQDLSMAALPMLVLLDRTIRQRPEADRGPASAAHLSPAWTAAFLLAVGSLYAFRIAAEAFPMLLMRGCLLAVPLLLLWIVSLRVYTSQPAVAF
ncbi:MAG: glycosyltransferase family 87 protein [Terriglobales bacterium]